MWTNNSGTLMRALLLSLAWSGAMAGLARADRINLALNPSRTGFPTPLESDAGWGGGSYPWEIVDGKETYPEWPHGLAFTGGHTGGWDSGGWIEPAGPRQATIDFGSMQTFSEVDLWHHGREHIPAMGTTSLDYWDGNAWIAILFDRSIPNTSDNTSIQDIYSFGPVTGSKVRWSFDNRLANIDGNPLVHGWLYEFEVYAVPEPAALVSLGLGGAVLIGFLGLRRRRSRASIP